MENISTLVLVSLGTIFLIMEKTIYRYIIFSVIGLNIIINYGISNMGVSIGGILITVSEGLLIIGLIRMIAYKNELLFLKKKYIWMVILFLIFIIRIPFDFLKYGSFAIKDGSHFIDMLFFFVVISEIEILKKYNGNHIKFAKKFIEISMIFAWIYFLTLPFRFEILEISPKYSGIQSQISIFGSYVNLHIWVLIYSCINSYRLIYKNVTISKKIFMHIQIVTSLLYFIFNTSRVNIVAMIVLGTFYILVLKSTIFKYVMSYTILSIIMISLAIALGFEILVDGQILSLDYVKGFFLSMIGKGEFEYMTDGVYKRIDWYKSILEVGVSNIGIFVFGQGFGMPLTQFVSAQGTIVREPHNTFMSLFGRTGLLGVIIWSKIIFGQLYKYVRRFYSSKNEYSFSIITMIIFCLIVSLVEPFFESTFSSIPFYSLLGIWIYLEYYDYNIYKNNKIN